MSLSTSSFILMCHFKSLYSITTLFRLLPNCQNMIAMPEQIPDPLAHCRYHVIKVTSLNDVIP